MQQQQVDAKNSIVSRTQRLFTNSPIPFKNQDLKEEKLEKHFTTHLPILKQLI